MERARNPAANIQRTIVKGSQEAAFQAAEMWAGVDAFDIPVEDQYFYSYSHYSIHEEMLKDHTRTEAYMHAILQNPELFEGKVVLDVGCGTGILSIFAARAGAKHVYGIDAAEIAHCARAIVAENHLSDRITIIQATVETAELPVQYVDVIVSEWMGYFLLYEAMLETVLFARDKWLAPGGIMLPDVAELFFAGIEDAVYKEGKVDFWDSVYGVNMSVLKEAVLCEPLVDNIDCTSICTETISVHRINLETITKEDIYFVSKYRVKATRRDTIYALVAWFDVRFTHGCNKFDISTSPRQPSTHWKQTLFYIDTPFPLYESEELFGTIAVRKHPQHAREVEVKISFNSSGRYPMRSLRYYRLK